MVYLSMQPLLHTPLRCLSRTRSGICVILDAFPFRSWDDIIGMVTFAGSHPNPHSASPPGCCLHAFMAMLACRQRFCITPFRDGIVATRMQDIVLRINFRLPKSTEVLPRNPTPSPKKDLRIMTYHEVLSTRCR